MLKTLIAAALLSSIQFISSVSAATERIIIVYNADTKADLESEDAQMRAANITQLTALVREADPTLMIEPAPIRSKEELKSIGSGSNLPIRGLVFLGHGKETAYALNKAVQFESGSDFSELLANLLNKNILSDHTVVYFNGCRNAHSLKGQATFQESLYQSLLPKLSADRREGIEIIAQSYIVPISTAGSAPPNPIDRLFYKTKIGVLAERYSLSLTRLTGFRPAPDMPALIGAVLLAQYGLPGYELPIATGWIASVLLRETAKRAVAPFGRSLSGDRLKTGSVYDLLSSSFKNKCLNAYE